MSKINESIGKVLNKYELQHQRFMKKQVKIRKAIVGYRVDHKLRDTGTYIEYTSRKQLCTEEMAFALGRGLERQGQAGRIIKIENKVETVVKEWDFADTRS